MIAKDKHGAYYNSAYTEITEGNERLQAELKAENAALREKAAAYDAIENERNALRVEVAGLRTSERAQEGAAIVSFFQYDQVATENAALKAEVMSLADERDGFKAALVQALAEVERLTALRVEMFNAIVEYGAGDDLLYHVLKAIMDAWFAGWAL